LIPRKIIENVANRCHILKLKCAKFDFGWGSLQRSPYPVAEFKCTSKGMEGRKEEREGKRKGRRGKGIGRDGEEGKRTSTKIHQ